MTTEQACPPLLIAQSAIDGRHLALTLVAASDRPGWVDQIVRDAPAELLRDALRFLAVGVVGEMLGDGSSLSAAAAPA